MLRLGTLFDNRVRLVGTLRTIVVSGRDFRNAFGLAALALAVNAA